MEIGTYLVVSTVHIRCATGDLLARWARLPPAGQPIAVSPTPHGWFVAAQALDELPDGVLPDDLSAILAFGRDQGCDYVLLDCDGKTSAALTIFPWRPGQRAV